MFGEQCGIIAQHGYRIYFLEKLYVQKSYEPLSSEKKKRFMRMRIKSIRFCGKMFLWARIHNCKIGSLVYSQIPSLWNLQKACQKRFRNSKFGKLRFMKSWNNTENLTFSQSYIFSSMSKEGVRKFSPSSKHFTAF